MRYSGILATLFSRKTNLTIGASRSPAIKDFALDPMERTSPAASLQGILFGVTGQVPATGDACVSVRKGYSVDFDNDEVRLDRL